MEAYWFLVHESPGLPLHGRQAFSTRQHRIMTGTVLGFASASDGSSNTADRIRCLHQ